VRSAESGVGRPEGGRGEGGEGGGGCRRGRLRDGRRRGVCATSVAGAHGFGGVGDDGDAVGGADGFQPGQVAALAVEVGGNDGFGEPAATGAVGEFFGEEIRVEVPGVGVGVKEGEFGALVGDGVDAADEGEGGGEDEVAGAEAEFAEGEVHGGGPAGEGEAMGDAGVLGELALEGVNHGAQRGDVIGGEGFLDEGKFIAAEVRRGRGRCGEAWGKARIEDGRSRMEGPANAEWERN
jgi:hypothetical protein